MSMFPLALLLLACGEDPKPDVERPVDSDDSGAPDDTGSPDDDDADDDGFAADTDCDDADPDVFPGAPEVCDARDNNCDGAADEGFSAPACITDAACTLEPLPADVPEPLLYLPFEAADPYANLGALPAADYVVSSLGTTTAAGAVGDALAFSPASSSRNPHMVIGTTPALEASTLTVSAWVRPTESTFDRGTLLNALWDSAPAGYSLDWYAGFLFFRVADGTRVETVAAPLPGGAWSHVAATFDGSVMTVYVNGERRVRHLVADDFAGLAHYPANLAVGAYQSAAYYAYDGRIDELRLYDQALSAAQLRRELTLGHWRFEADGVARDSSTYGQHEATETPRPTACGPVGDAWVRAAADAPVTLPASDRLQTRAQLGVSAWVRPESGSGTLAAVEGAWSLDLDAGTLRFTVTGEGGATATVEADVAARLGRWFEVSAGFDGSYVRLFVDGVEAGSTRAGFFALAASDADLVLGADLDGGLDEVRLSARAPDRAEAALGPALIADFDGLDRTDTTTALTDAGPLGLALTGAGGASTVDDRLFPCDGLPSHLRTSCAHQTGTLTAETPVHGPLTLGTLVRPLAVTTPFAYFGVTDGPALEVGPDGYALVWGDVRAAGGPAPEDRWTPVTGVIAADRLQLYVDGVLVAEAPLPAPYPNTSRFTLGTGLSWSSGPDGEDAVWVQRARASATARTEAEVQRVDAPWWLEEHPRLPSHETEVALGGEPDFATADATLAAFRFPESSPTSETWSHYERAQAAHLLAAAASRADAEGDAASAEAYADGALRILENADTGLWAWSWFQGVALSFYAESYDLVAGVLESRLAADPHTWGPRLFAARRQLLGMSHRIATVGQIGEDPVYYEYGLDHYSPGWISANSRLLVVGGLGHLGLALPEGAEPELRGGADWLELAVDDLFYDRPGDGQARGRALEHYLSESGVYCEGNGYQSDVFYRLTPFLIDWWQLGGEDRISDGRVRAMYDGNVAGMLPTGQTMLFGTGWLQTVPHNDLVAAYVPDVADTYRWFADRQYQRATPYAPPPWTSAVLGTDAAVLRGGWDVDDTQLTLLGRTTPCYSGHAQADQMSLSLMAHGALLLLDPGDGRYYRGTADADQEVWLQSASGHNNVLVDGVGPQIVHDLDALVDPATVTTSLFQDRVDYTRLDGTLGDGAADHTRRAWLLDDTVTVVHDALAADTSHTWSQQWHLGGPLDSGDGTYRVDAAGGALDWATTGSTGEDVTLTVQQVGPLAPLSWSTYTDGGTNFIAATWEHPYVRVEQAGSSADYLTLLLTGTPDEPAPVAVVLDDREDVRLAQIHGDGIGTIEVLWSTSGGEEVGEFIVSDALLAATDGADWLHLSEGTTAWLADDRLGARAACALTALSLSASGSEVSGVLAWEGAACPLELAAPDGAPTTVTVDGVATGAWTWADGVLTLDPGPTRSFEVGR